MKVPGLGCDPGDGLGPGMDLNLCLLLQFSRENKLSSGMLFFFFPAEPPTNERGEDRATAVVEF